MDSSKALAGKLVLITGVGLKPVRHRFYEQKAGSCSHLPIHNGGIEMKANIGAAVAIACVTSGAEVVMCARSQDTLAFFARWIQRNVSEVGSPDFYAGDLTTKEGQTGLEDHLRSRYDRQLYWVNSLGLGGGTISVPGENPYLPWQDTDDELLHNELRVVEATHTLTKRLWPFLTRQGGTRIVYVSSMSALRAYHLGAAHCPGKAALHAQANVMQLAAYDQGVYVTEVLPGAVDTGLYDPTEVQEAVMQIYRSYGFKGSEIRLGNPKGVATMIVGALTAQMHVTQINLVAFGQPPHRGS